jgi:tetratricopeptide (TPR) repeat protein
MNNNNTYVALVSLFLTPCALLAEDEVAPLEDIDETFEQTVPVADEVVVDMPQAASDAPTEEQLLNEFNRYRQLVAADTLDEADIAAKRIVEMSIKVYGPQSRETASSLNNLGIVQHRNGQYDAAIQNFTATVEIIESTEDRLNSALVNPLKGLGAAQLSIGRPDRARATLDRAAHITRVNNGPHNIGQVEILESIAETHIRMDDLKGARNILDRIHILNVKYFEEDPLGLLPSLMRRAEWQHRAGFFGEEGASYRSAIRIIESSNGKDSPLLVEPLRKLGETFYFADMTPAETSLQGRISTGEGYFRRSARIAEQSEDMDWHDSTRSRIALADYYIFTDSQNKARRIYEETWHFLSEDDERIATRIELFSKPTPIQVNVLPTFAGNGPIDSSESEELLSGKIVVEYEVSAKGRVRNLRTGASPPEFIEMQRMVHREIRSRLFRPRLVDAEPVASKNLIFEHEFNYFQSDLDAIKESLAEAEEGKKK